MTEQLEKRGYSKHLIGWILNFWPDKKELRKKIKGILEDAPNPSKPEMVRLLTTGRSEGKSHASVGGDSEKPKVHGKRAAKPRPGSVSRY